MKKSLLLIASIAAAAVVSLVSIKVVSAHKANELFYENVEVLADGEAHGRSKCYISYSYSETENIYVCGTCEWVNGAGVKIGGICVY